MAYQFRNLVFEGGGVKGIAYVGAMEVLEQKGILKDIKRVGGTSAGAINAVLVATGFSNVEQKSLLQKIDFRKFMDDSFGVVRDTQRLINEFGWYKGDYFYRWIGDRLEEKLNNRQATFRDLKEQGGLDLYVYGTNLSTRFGEVFSEEHTPHERIADAVRISMSIPLFFMAVRNPRRDVYVDGGVLNNYPVKLFDRMKYIDGADQATMARETEYYRVENQRFLPIRPSASPYVYNRQTLGLRLDSAREIGVFRDRREPPHVRIDDFFDYALALLETIMESQGNQHLHSDDWQRTIYIDTIGVGTTNFDLTDALKAKLVQSGIKGTEDYFRWFEDMNNKPANRA
ncbi:MAG: patatin-like phospholipase family protein [Rhodospirillales bacterium]|nr:patatin-like phospholipase family protein [Rhodospirillales bacterium]